MTPFQWIFVTLSLAREIMKYLAEKEKNKREATQRAKQLHKAFKKANKEGNTDELEKAFASLNLPSPK